MRRYAARRNGATREKRQARAGLFKQFELDELRAALTEKYPGDARIIGLVDSKSKELHDGVSEVQRVLSQYSRLATLGNLIDRVLHDGRTSVAKLKGIVRFGGRDLAKVNVTDEEKVLLATASLAQTSVQAELLASLFNQIEPFGGRRRGRPKSISVASIVERAMVMFESEMNDAGIVATSECEDIHVTLDMSEILTVLINLIQNSIYWLSGESGTNKRIVIGSRRNPDGSVSFSVSDSGPGVAEELRESIFDPYFSAKPQGVGLGLSIAGNVVEDLYDGELRLVDRGPLEGATFEAILRKRIS